MTYDCKSLFTTSVTCFKVVDQYKVYSVSNRDKGLILRIDVGRFGHKVETLCECKKLMYFIDTYMISQ